MCQHIKKTPATVAVVVDGLLRNKEYKFINEKLMSLTLENTDIIIYSITLLVVYGPNKDKLVDIRIYFKNLIEENKRSYRRRRSK